MLHDLDSDLLHGYRLRQKRGHLLRSSLWVHSGFGLCLTFMPLKTHTLQKHGGWMANRLERVHLRNRLKHIDP